MTREELKLLTGDLIRVLKEAGYTENESGDVLEASGELIKELRHEKSKKNSGKEDIRLRVYDERLSIL